MKARVRGLRVLHVNDVAFVASTLVAALRDLGVAADLRTLHLPAARARILVKLAALPLRIAELVDVDRQARRGRYDLLHIHYAYLGVLAALGGHPAVVHCHGTDVRGGLRDPLRRPLVLAALRAARAVLVSTPDLLGLVRSVREDAEFVPNPVDTALFRTFPRVDGPLRILLISDAHPLKGLETAVPPAIALRQRGVEVRAIDRGAADRERYRRLGVTTFVPAVPHAEMPRLIAGHDIVIGRFGMGSLGNNELESMACGRPVVAEHRFDDVYAEAPPVLALADLPRLIDDATLRAEVGARGRSWVERQHEAHAVARRVIAIYERVTGAASKS